jgi:hypothetical protein
VRTPQCCVEWILAERGRTGASRSDFVRGFSDVQRNRNGTLTKSEDADCEASYAAPPAAQNMQE